jgi:hypothetical protein
VLSDLSLKLNFLQNFKSKLRLETLWEIGQIAILFSCVLQILLYKVMAIYRNKPPVLSPVKVNDTIIPYSTKLKNLGVFMNCNLTWEDQISS